VLDDFPLPLAEQRGASTRASLSGSGRREAIKQRFLHPFPRDRGDFAGPEFTHPLLNLAIPRIRGAGVGLACVEADEELVASCARSFVESFSALANSSLATVKL